MKARIIAVITLVGLAVTFPLWARVAGAETIVGNARILHLEGTVQAKAPQDKEWKVMQKGAWLEQGTAVKTTTDSSCDIALGENRKSVVHMKADSQTVMASLNPGSIRVDLQQGRLFALVRDLKKESKFEVSSPTAIASARGTGWEQTLDSVHVFERSVDVVGANGEEMLVEEGKGIEISTDGNLGEAFDLPAEAKQEWNRVEVSAEQHVAEEPSLPDEKPIVPEKSTSTEGEPPNTPDSHDTASTLGGNDGFGGQHPDMPGNTDGKTTENLATSGPKNDFDGDGFSDSFSNSATSTSPEGRFEQPGTAAGEGGITDEVHEQMSQVVDLSKCFSHGGTNTSC